MPIVSANVGGAVAGQVVIPEPMAPAYATWPDILKKEAGDVLSIFKDRLARGGSDPDDDEIDRAVSPAPRSSAPIPAPRTAGLTGFAALGLIILGIFVLRLVR